MRFQNRENKRPNAFLYIRTGSRKIQQLIGKATGASKVEGYLKPHETRALSDYFRHLKKLFRKNNRNLRKLRGGKVMRNYTRKC